jgi:hypothetical protein
VGQPLCCMHILVKLVCLLLPQCGWTSPRHGQQRSSCAQWQLLLSLICLSLTDQRQAITVGVFAVYGLLMSCSVALNTCRPAACMLQSVSTGCSQPKKLHFEVTGNMTVRSVAVMNSACAVGHAVGWAMLPAVRVMAHSM